jgi:tripartite-type tricarboxylate transporter receptor subunit TctC
MIKQLIVILLLLSPTCYSQTTITVPTTAGGAVDSLTRKFAKFVELKSGQTFVIENLGGAGGNIGIEKFLKSKPNSLMVTSSSWYLSINSGRFNLVDFKPIMILAEAPFFLAVNKTQKLSCNKLKSNTGKYFLGSATLSHTEIISKMISELYPTIENVPYKAVKPATVDLLGNHINAVIIGSSTDIVEPLTILANSTDRKINGIPTFADCLGINNPITMDFLLIANSTSDLKFIESIEKLAIEFLRDKEIRDYYKENIMYNLEVKNITSYVLLQLNRWKQLGN